LQQQARPEACYLLDRAGQVTATREDLVDLGT
jgi:hypothetical protein